jgi:hypothetical protein
VADGSSQQNPGGIPYNVLNPNVFDDVDGDQQQCQTLTDALKALTAIRPTEGAQDQPLTAQPVHDILMFLLSKIPKPDDGEPNVPVLDQRRSALWLPGLCPVGRHGTDPVASAWAHTNISEPDFHAHYVWDKTNDGNWFRKTSPAIHFNREWVVEQELMKGWKDNTSLNDTIRDSSNYYYPETSPEPFTGATEGTHWHSVDLGARPNLLPVFFHSFHTPIPFWAFVRANFKHQGVKLVFHVNQQPLHGTGGILNGVTLSGGDTPDTVMPAILNAFDAALNPTHRMWIGDWSNTSQDRSKQDLAKTAPNWPELGNSAYISDAGRQGGLQSWAPTYEIHLGYWLYKAYWASLVNVAPGEQPGVQLGYSVNPYGITFWPGSMLGLSGSQNNGTEWLGAYDVIDAAANWMGRNPDFNFDTFVMNSIWGGTALSDAQKLAHYESYLRLMQNRKGAYDVVPYRALAAGKFTGDGRVHPTSCRTPLGLPYTLTVLES